ncbi:RNA polymerase sigma factor [Hymenobacter caeli]|uniref:RNA polymerase sigma-70 factor (ECF subfamily) n=1 Tax=Hymenobacter caeli TaxID=2735894 RepID=A0ABX2FQZ9_9BACT|nr:sigma-70 family RNA polymerase sigma factor [Hymenobacter caeli]NRT18966.1 RNA polymerase sigma-70 factor (ECF subfamily) [Hymenobacter caeli]
MEALLLTPRPTTGAVPQCPEAALIRRLQARDERALTDFAARYGDNLRGLVRGLVPDAVMAQDVWQECLLRLWQSFPHYAPGHGRLTGWARRICRNVAIDELRAPRWRDLRVMQPLAQSAEAQGRAASGGFQPEHLGLLALCAQLRPVQRQVIDLIYGHDLTFEQTAQRLNLSKGTVTTRARAAYRVLGRHTA